MTGRPGRGKMPDMDDAPNGSSTAVHRDDEWCVTLAAGAGAIDAARALVDALCAARSEPEGVRLRLALVVEELVSNALRHGAAAELRLCLRALDGGGVQLGMSDDGVAFDPRIDRPEDPRDTDPLARAAGGLGWPLVLHYCRIDGYRRSAGRNHLRLHFRADGA